MSGNVFSLILEALLLFTIGLLAIIALKLLRRYEFHFPPAGARRTPCNKDVGDFFPVDGLPAPLREKVQQQETLFLFLGKSCFLCEPIIEALPSFVRSYRNVLFVVFGLQPEDV